MCAPPRGARSSAASSVPAVCARPARPRPQPQARPPGLPGSDLGSRWPWSETPAPPTPGLGHFADQVRRARRQVRTCRTPGPTPSNASFLGTATRPHPRPETGPVTGRPSGESRTPGRSAAGAEAARRSRGERGAGVGRGEASGRRPRGLENKLAVQGPPALGPPPFPPCCSQGGSELHAARRRGLGRRRGARRLRRGEPPSWRPVKRGRQVNTHGLRTPRRGGQPRATERTRRATARGRVRGQNCGRARSWETPGSCSIPRTPPARNRRRGWPAGRPRADPHLALSGGLLGSGCAAPPGQALGLVPGPPEPAWHPAWAPASRCPAGRLLRRAAREGLTLVQRVQEQEESYQPHAIKRP